MTKYLIPFLMILGAAFSRVLPHPANVAPITALALFGAVHLGKKYAFIIPLAAMLLSDYVLGFYHGMIWVYASFIAIGCIGLWLRSRLTVVRMVTASMTGSVLFFIVTNFGVWISSQVTYSHSVAGLEECYIAAIPFFRNTLVGDIAYSGIMFGVYELLSRFVPSLQQEQAIQE
jgi:hypothetical protein